MIHEQVYDYHSCEQLLRKPLINWKAKVIYMKKRKENPNNFFYSKDTTVLEKEGRVSTFLPYYKALKFTTEEMKLEENITLSLQHFTRDQVATGIYDLIKKSDKKQSITNSWTSSKIMQIWLAGGKLQFKDGPQGATTKELYNCFIAILEKNCQSILKDIFSEALKECILLESKEDKTMLLALSKKIILQSIDCQRKVSKLERATVFTEQYLQWLNDENIYDELIKWLHDNEFVLSGKIIEDSRHAYISLINKIKSKNDNDVVKSPTSSSSVNEHNLRTTEPTESNKKAKINHENLCPITLELADINTIELSAILPDTYQQEKPLEQMEGEELFAKYVL